MEDIFTKFEKLKTIIRDMESILVAYSGGVDSTFLAKISRDILQDKSLALIAKSETYSSYEIENAIKTAGELKLKYLIIETKELEDNNFSKNPENRCYYCKRELFSKLIELAKENNIKYVADGTNYDDIKDFRPGRIAASELGIRSPLKEAFLTKDDIRLLSKSIGLSTWNKPSYACLASRFPYGTSITIDDLRRIDDSERFLKELGFKQVRVRHYNKIARIEVEKEEMKKIFEDGIIDKILDKLEKSGYVYVTLDLKGYRTGSMNEDRVSGEIKNGE